MLKKEMALFKPEKRGINLKKTEMSQKTKSALKIEFEFLDYVFEEIINGDIEESVNIIKNHYIQLNQYEDWLKNISETDDMTDLLLFLNKLNLKPFKQR